MCEKKIPHVHAELIKAWADGSIIQYRYSKNWFDCPDNHPDWNQEDTYRIKPEPKSLGQVAYEAAFSTYAKETVTPYKCLSSETRTAYERMAQAVINHK